MDEDTKPLPKIAKKVSAEVTNARLDCPPSEASCAEMAVEEEGDEPPPPTREEEIEAVQAALAAREEVLNAGRHSLRRGRSEEPANLPSCQLELWTSMSTIKPAPFA
eukprot:6032155-Amphidinium_carterae.1